MTNLKAFITAIAGIGFVKLIIETWSFIWFVLIPVIALSIVYGLTKRARRKALIEMNRRMDDIIIVCSPGGDIEVDRIEAIYCKSKHMFKHVQNYSALVEQSANPYGIKVKLFIFQDGEFINENEEEFKERVQTAVFEARAARHGELKKK